MEIHDLQSVIMILDMKENKSKDVSLNMYTIHISYCMRIQPAQSSVFSYTEIVKLYFCLW